jgi:hypothetical protein
MWRFAPVYLIGRGQNVQPAFSRFNRSGANRRVALGVSLFRRIADTHRDVDLLDAKST